MSKFHKEFFPAYKSLNIREAINKKLDIVINNY
jgi:hypothetical protein